MIKHLAREKWLSRWACSLFCQKYHHLQKWFTTEINHVKGLGPTPRISPHSSVFNTPRLEASQDNSRSFMNEALWNNWYYSVLDGGCDLRISGYLFIVCALLQIIESYTTLIKDPSTELIISTAKNGHPINNKTFYSRYCLIKNNKLWKSEIYPIWHCVRYSRFHSYSNTLAV